MPLDLAAALRRPLFHRFPADRAYPRAAFHADGMPPLVAAFLDRTLDRWVALERDRFRSDWFDFDDGGVQRAEAQFFDALADVARIPADAWEETLGGAVDLVVRFLTVPARALTDALFEGTDDPLPTDDVRARLSLFDAYPYLAEVATAYLDRKQPETLDPAALFALLDRIDRRVVSEYEREDWLDLLAPLFALARYAPALNGVPAARLQRFFEAKGEADLADRIAEHVGSVLDEAQLRDVLAPAFPEPTPAEPEAPEDEAADGEDDEPEAAEPPPDETLPDEPAVASAAPNQPVIPEPEISDLEVAEWDDTERPPPPEASDAATSDRPDPTPDSAAPSLPIDPEEEPAPTAVSDPNDEPPRTVEPPSDRDEPSHDEPPSADADENANDALPLWQRFAERTSDGDSVNARFGGDDEGDELGDDTASVPLWKRFFSRSDDDASPSQPPPTVTAAPSAPAPARADSLDTLEERVLGATPSAQRKRFVKHLFGGDAGKYATVLHTLETATSWTEASKIIARDVFRPSRINIYGEHAVAFTDAVEARFRD